MSQGSTPPPAPSESENTEVKSKTNSKVERAAGIYKQDKENTFVLIPKNNKLYLKTSDIDEELLTARGDGLYDVANTNVKIKINYPTQGPVQSITLFLPDRQIVAVREVVIDSDKSFGKKIKELGIFIVIVFALIGVISLFYGPIKDNCLKTGSVTSCRVADLLSPWMGRVKEREAIRNKLDKNIYREVKMDIVEDCEAGVQDSCLEIAKQKLHIGSEELAYDQLEKSCYEFKHGTSCQFWYNTLLEKEKLSEANEVLKKSCKLGVGLSCHEYAWRLRKLKNQDFVRYYALGCQYKIYDSCYELGLFHLRFSRDEAYKFLTQACNGYHRKGCELKDKVEKFNKVKEICISDKEPRSCYLQASFEYDYGDKEKSIQLYNDACILGSPHACSFLKQKKVREYMSEKGIVIEGTI